METARLLKAGGGFAGRLQAIEGLRFWSEKAEGVVVGTPHRQQVYNLRDFMRSEAKWLRRIAKLAGLVNHGPFVEPMASEERSSVRRAREKLTEPLNEVAPFLRQGLDCYPMSRCDVAGDAKIELRLVSPQRTSKARMPSPQ
jgi:hypothetical protein